MHSGSDLVCNDVQARQWREALRLAWQAQQGGLVDSAIAPAAEEAGDATITEAQEDIQRVHKYLQRLQEVCTWTCFARRNGGREGPISIPQ